MIILYLSERYLLEKISDCVLFYFFKYKLMRLLLFLSVLLTSSPLFAQSNKQIVKETIKKYKNHQTMSYDISYSMKFLDDNKPTIINSSVFIKKENKDKIFSSTFLYNREDDDANYIKYYKSPFIYIIDKKEEKVLRSDASKGDFYKSFINGNIDGNVREVYFTDISKLQWKLWTTKNTINYSDSLNYLKIEISFPDENEYYEMKEIVYIDKSTKIITSFISQIKYKDQLQLKSWTINNVKFDQFKDEDLNSMVNFYMDTYEIEDYQTPTEEDFKLLENYVVAPVISGVIFPNYKQNTEINYDKITILDFWYTSCMPCIKAIPYLNSLNEKYKGNIEVIGVNPFEYEPENQETIESFLNRTPIDYSIFLIKDLPQEFNINVYPTVYVIDAKGRVRYSQMGLNEETYKEIDSLLQQLIHEN